MIELNDNENFYAFSTTEEKLNKLKEWGLISPKSNTLKPILYKGIYADNSIECEIIGYIYKENSEKHLNPFYETAVLKIDTKSHKINPSYLKQMQSSTFNRYGVSE